MRTPPEWESPPSSIPYEQAAEGPDHVAPGRARSDDDLILLYTGGTTGMPKGVMWRQADMVSLLNSLERRGIPERGGPAELAAFFAGRRPGMRSLIACPLMHGTALFFALGTLNPGGAVATLPTARFSGEALLDTLDADPGRRQRGRDGDLQAQQEQCGHSRRRALRWKPTAASASSAGARTASTRRGRRSSPKRSRKR